MKFPLIACTLCFFIFSAPTFSYTPTAHPTLIATAATPINGVGAGRSGTPRQNYHANHNFNGVFGNRTRENFHRR